MTARSNTYGAQYMRRRREVGPPLSRRAHYAMTVDDMSVRQRTKEEMDARKSKPNPAARPAANNSPALAALRKSLKAAVSKAERTRIETLIRHTESLYRPPGTEKSAPKKREPAPPPLFRPGTVRAYAVAQLLHVDHWDPDGRAVGFTIAEVMRRVAGQFPDRRLTTAELDNIKAAARAKGATFPFRPRSRRGKPSARLVSDTGKRQRANAGAAAAGRNSKKAA